MSSSSGVPIIEKPKARPYVWFFLFDDCSVYVRFTRNNGHSAKIVPIGR